MRNTTSGIWLACAGVLLAAGCGPRGADGPLAAAGEKLADIRSGVMTLRLVATARSGADTGFEVSGPFSLPEDDSLPTADLTLEQLGVKSAEPVRFISTGRSAYVETGGTAYELPPENTESLRGDPEAGQEGPFDQLELDSWVIDPKTSEGETVDGVETETISGRLDVLAAANDLFGLAQDLGGTTVPGIEGEEAERLRAAVESASLEVVIGRDDELLRRLRIDVDLSASAPERLEPALGDLLGVKFSLLLAIEDPNEPVRVEPPPDFLPAH
jgi:hypothetical protein